MKRNVLLIIAITTTISVIGLVVTQYLWANRAIKLRAEQFDAKIEGYLLNVVNQISELQKEEAYLCKTTDTISIRLNNIKKEQEKSKKLYSMIDTLLVNEFTCFNNDKYYYAVIDSSLEKIIFSDNPENYDDELINSDHKISLNKVSLNKNLILSVFFPKQRIIVSRRMFMWVQFLSGVFLLIVISCFLYIIVNVIKQKKISEMKNDFVNNMTHEFKTPISTISVASEMLMKPAVCNFPEKIQKYANIIYDENVRLRNQVEQVLQISVLDRKEIDLHPTKIDIHPIIENSVDIFNMIINEKHREIIADLNAQNSEIFVDELHFINVITNMLDNAIKYSENTPKIKLTTFNKNDEITIRIEDNGIGIDSSNHKLIYKKFFRVHTGDVHNVKGFGLGLFYVKSVMGAHGGSVELVKSELGKGSIFELHFPLNNNNNNNANL